MNKTHYKAIFDWLSIPNVLQVTGSYDHISDRMVGRSIDFEVALRSFVSIIKNNLCLDLYETQVHSGSKNFKVDINGLRIFYSVYIYNDKYKVVFRTIMKAKND